MKWVIRVALTLVGLLVLSSVVLFAMGQRSNAGRTTTSVDIQAPRATVWAWLNDHQKMKQWVGWVVEVRTVVDKTGVGSKEVWVMKDPNMNNSLVEVTSECTEYVPEQRITVALSSQGMFAGDQSYQLADAGNGATRLTIDGRYRYSMWFARLMEPVITPSAEKKMVADMAHLKSLIEANP
jgi:uncharacterized protein YndB with AHSA1/START domain